MKKLLLTFCTIFVLTTCFGFATKDSNNQIDVTSIGAGGIIGRV